MLMYIKFDFVGFFLLMSNRMTVDRTYFPMKSSRTVKSSKTCWNSNYARIAYLVDRQESPEKSADFLVERDHHHRIGKVGQLRFDYILEILGKAEIKRVKINPAVQHAHQPIMLVDGKVFAHLGFGFFG